MDVRITANYAATDGRMPESVDVTFENASPGEIKSGLPPVLDMLLMAPLARDRARETEVERHYCQIYGDLSGQANRSAEESVKTLNLFGHGADVVAEATWPKYPDVTSSQPQRDGDRMCLRMGCGHSEGAHAGESEGINACAICHVDHACAGFVGTTPARLTAAANASRGELLASDTYGHVRQSVDSRGVLMLGTAASAIKQNDALTWLPPTETGSTYGSWIKKGSEG